MTTPTDFVDAFPTETLYAVAGWITVCRLPDDSVLIVRSSLIRPTDTMYVEALQHVGALEMVESETMQTGGNAGWEGGSLISEVWGPRLEDLPE